MRVRQTRGIRLAFSTVGNRVEETLLRSGLTEKMGAHWIFPSVHVAVQHCIRHRMRAAADAPTARGNGGVKYAGGTGSRQEEDDSACASSTTTSCGRPGPATAATLSSGSPTDTFAGRAVEMATVEVVAAERV